MEDVEAPQPQVAMPVDVEVHQPQGPEPMEATTNKDVMSGRTEPSTAAPSAPTPELLATSVQQAKKDDIVPVIEPST
jgi:hypothetical protein